MQHCSSLSLSRHASQRKGAISQMNCGLAPNLDEAFPRRRRVAAAVRMIYIIVLIIAAGNGWGTTWKGNGRGEGREGWTRLSRSLALSLAQCGNLPRADAVRRRGGVRGRARSEGGREAIDSMGAV